MEGKDHTYHNANDRWPALHTLPLELSHTINFTSAVNMFEAPFTKTWLLRSMYDLSTINAAICLSSNVRERDFLMASQGQILITPLSEPDQRSPG